MPHTPISFAWDALAVVFYFTVILVIGLRARRGARSVEGFTLGNRQMPWWAVLASILAAEISAATFLGAPGEGFAHRNFTYAQLALGTVIGRVIIAYLFIKTYYDFQVISIYEFLERRFGTVSKNAASAVFLATRVLASGTRLYVAAVVVVLAIEMVGGFRPDPTSEILIYAVALTIVTALTALYTTVGGIKAVIWTDVIQASVMVAALVYALGSLISAIPGGLGGAGEYLQAPEDLAFITSGIEPNLGLWSQIKHILQTDYTIWAALLGATFVTMATHGTDQDMVQRMLTAQDHHRSRLALIMSGIADVPVVLAFLSVGILLYVFYQVHPDPNLPASNPQVFPYYILHELPPGARGLLVAGVLSTAMGSLSTALNALATSFVKDWWLPYFSPHAGEREEVRALRWSTVGFALLLIVVGCVTAWAVVKIPGSRIIPIVLGAFGYTYGSLLGVFLVGMTTRTRGTCTGNLIGMAAGFVVVGILSGLPFDILKLLGIGDARPPEWLPIIAFPWRVLFGSAVTYFVALCFVPKPPPASAA